MWTLVEEPFDGHGQYGRRTVYPRQHGAIGLIVHHVWVVIQRKAEEGMLLGHGKL
jgi:hypothetical protein